MTFGCYFATSTFLLTIVHLTIIQLVPATKPRIFFLRHHLAGLGKTVRYLARISRVKKSIFLSAGFLVRNIVNFFLTMARNLHILARNLYNLARNYTFWLDETGLGEKKIWHYFSPGLVLPKILKNRWGLLATVSGRTVDPRPSNQEVVGLIPVLPFIRILSLLFDPSDAFSGFFSLTLWHCFEFGLLAIVYQLVDHLCSSSL